MAENLPVNTSLTPEEVAYFESEGASPLPGIQEAEHVEEKRLQAEAEELEQQDEQTEQGDKPRDEKGRYVPHEAFHAEREKRKAFEREVNELKTFKAVMEDRWKTLLTATDKPAEKAEEDPEPDANVDIFAHNAWLKRQIDKERSIRSERDEAEKASRVAQEQEQAVWSEWHQSAQSYMAETPDFGDAVKFMSDLRDKQLQALSFANPQLRNEQGRVQQINAELKSIIQAAKQQGLSPAQAVYQLAQGFGYQKAAQAPVRAAPQSPQMPEKLEKVAKAQEASRTLGQASGAPGGDAMTIDSLSKMGQAEFNAWVASPGNEVVFRRLMGG